MNAIVKCANCSVTFADEVADSPNHIRKHEPCPLCGSSDRLVDIGPLDELLNYEDFRFRQMQGRVETGNPTRLFDMADRHKSARVVDRSHDCYYELVTDRDSGEILFESCQSLSEHVDLAHTQDVLALNVQIAVAAYYLWEAEGFPDGRDLDHWEAARKQLSEANLKPEDVEVPKKSVTRASSTHVRTVASRETT